jgi:DNA-binding phage protein
MPGKTKKVAAGPSQAADRPRPDTEIAAYIEPMLEDGDARAVPAALRTVADAAAGLEKADGIMRRYRRTLRVLAK